MDLKTMQESGMLDLKAGKTTRFSKTMEPRILFLRVLYNNMHVFDNSRGETLS